MTAPPRVLAALWAGLVLTVLAAAVPFAATHLLADHLRAGYPAYTPAQIGSAVATYLILLSVIGGLGVLTWLATILAVRAGKRWARAVATAGLALGAGVGLTGLLVRDTAGGTGLPPAVGWAGLVPCLAGVLAVAWLWTRPRTV
ncbi:hypothetical protein [Amycolatopsis sp. NPDC051371]|uniref:hypothetical protein n=1 Tax=Amycolatopsis sp. NPDC051371 TaxID=3155800 RepID=UPI00343CD36E